MTQRLNICLSAIIFLVAISACVYSAQRQQDRVCFSSNCVNVEVVKEGEKLMRGLQYRKALAQDSGMLFVFPDDSLHRFWMKDTLIPLDMIWLNGQKNVIFIETHVPVCVLDPCPTYGPKQESRFVLEVNAGHAKAMGIEIGSKAGFTFYP